MKLFLVKRKTKVSYDEYDSCVIIAPDEEAIHDMLSKDRDENITSYNCDYTIEEILEWGLI